MKTYVSPRILAILVPEKAAIPRDVPGPSPETVRVLVNPRRPGPVDLKRLRRDELAETFSFKRKGFQKHVK